MLIYNYLSNIRPQQVAFVVRITNVKLSLTDGILPHRVAFVILHSSLLNVRCECQALNWIFRIVRVERHGLVLSAAALLRIESNCNAA